MRFLHPNAAYLFLFLIPLLVIYLRRPGAESLVVPSLAFWNSTDKDRKTDRQNTGYVLPSLSFLIFIGGMSLLILSIMTPIQTRIHLPDSGNLLAIRCTDNIPESARRVLVFLDDTILLNDDETFPEDIPNLTVCNSTSIPTSKGNILLLALSSEPDNKEKRQMSYDVISSGPDQEVVLFSFSPTDAKTVRFPIKMAEAVDHFRKEGVLPPSFPIQKEGRISLWLAAAAGIAILYALLIGKR